MWYKIYLLLSQWLILCSQYGIVNVRALIGNNVRQGSQSYPFIASVMLRDPRPSQWPSNHICTGTLISRQNILLAAHCLNDLEVDKVQVVLDAVGGDLRNGHVYYPFWWITYNQWANLKNIDIDNGANDIAIIKLTDRVSNKINHAYISNSPNEKLFNVDVLLVGWSVISNTKPAIVREANVQILPATQCAKRIINLHGNSSIWNNQLLCTIAHPHVLLTIGDSGGPVLYGNTVLGVNKGTFPSLAHKSDLNEKINIHLSVYYYTAFMRSIKKMT